MKRRRFWLKLAAGLLFAALVYGGAYAALVEPLMIVPDRPVVEFYATDHRWQIVARRFFIAANWADRRLRPNTWYPPFQTGFQFMQVDDGTTHE